MTNKEIKCLMYYDKYDSTEERVCHPAGCTKAEYLFESFAALGYTVSVLSASHTKGTKFVKGSTRSIGEHITLKVLPSLGRKGKLFNKLAMTLFSLRLMLELLLFVKKDDTLWVYHSLALMKFIRVLKKVKKFRLILEVEEIYGHVIGSPDTVKKEFDFFEYADAYVFPTILLNKSINIKNKPYAIAHGTYKSQDIISKPLDDGCIHCVYAGTLDVRKGVLDAVESVAFLPKGYHMHVLGFGSSEEIEQLCLKIEDVSKKTQATVTYDGLLSGDEYISFLQRCHIGLSPQLPNAEFNVSSFPSKVLSYMANGLRVVSVDIESIRTSDVGAFIHYYNNQTPEAIANAIKSVDMNKTYDSREVLNNLNQRFLSDMNVLIKQD